MELYGNYVCPHKYNELRYEYTENTFRSGPIFFFFLFSRLISWPLLTVHLILQIWAMNNFKILTNLLPQKHYFLLLKILILSSVLSLMDYLLLVIQRSIRCHLLPEALASSCFNSIHLCGSVVKNLPAMRETQIWSLVQEDHDPLRRKWQPTTVFLSGKPHGQRNLAGYSSRDGKELDMTSWLKTTKQLIQYSWCPYKKEKKKKLKKWNTARSLYKEFEGNLRDVIYKPQNSKGCFQHQKLRERHGTDSVLGP